MAMRKEYIKHDFVIKNLFYINHILSLDQVCRSCRIYFSHKSCKLAYTRIVWSSFACLHYFIDAHFVKLQMEWKLIHLSIYPSIYTHNTHSGRRVPGLVLAGCFVSLILATCTPLHAYSRSQEWVI